MNSPLAEGPYSTLAHCGSALEGNGTGGTIDGTLNCAVQRLNNNSEGIVVTLLKFTITKLGRLLNAFSFIDFIDCHLYAAYSTD